MKVISHFDLKPEILLVAGIQATQIIKPDGSDVMSAHKVWMEPWAKYPPHTHPSPHIIHVIFGEGTGRCGVGDRSHRLLLKTGGIFHIPANIVHQVCAGSKGMQMLVYGLETNGLHDPDRMTVLSKYPSK